MTPSNSSLDDTRGGVICGAWTARLPSGVRFQEPSRGRAGDDFDCVGRGDGYSAARGGGRGRDRQRAGMVRLRRLRLSCAGHLAALLSGRQSLQVLAGDARRVRRRLRHAAGGLGRLRHVRRPLRAPPRAGRGDLSDGALDGGAGLPADLWAGGTLGPHPARRLPPRPGLVGRRRMGWLDRLHRRARERRPTRLCRLVATGQRRLGLPAGIAHGLSPQQHAAARNHAELGLARAVPPRYRRRSGRPLAPAPPRRHARNSWRSSSRGKWPRRR